MRRLYCSRLLAAVILVCALAGVGIKMGIFQGRLELYQLRYFTTLSNLLAAACAAWAVVQGRRRYGGAKGLALLCILVTGTIYHTLLIDGFGGFALFSLEWWGDELVHTAVPVLCAADYLLFDPKGRLRGYYPPVWLLAPCSYFGVTVMIARQGIRFPNSVTAYPYPFLDVWALGWGPVLRNVLLLGAGFLLLGCMLLWLDRLLGEKEKSGAIS